MVRLIKTASVENRIEDMQDSRALRKLRSDFAITLPEDGAMFKLDPVLRREYQTVKFAIAVGELYRDVRLLVDGKTLSRNIKSNYYE